MLVLSPACRVVRHCLQAITLGGAETSRTSSPLGVGLAMHRTSLRAPSAPPTRSRPRSKEVLGELLAPCVWSLCVFSWRHDVKLQLNLA